ncbi:MAG: hypothetical protein R3302_06195, partial [Sulfurimonadaceae bacterium]|nr:hypothetical protein [Sulfurimonadaceae bacterium]
VRLWRVVPGADLFGLELVQVDYKLSCAAPDLSQTSVAMRHPDLVQPPLSSFSVNDDLLETPCREY